MKSIPRRCSSSAIKRCCSGLWAYLFHRPRPRDRRGCAEPTAQVCMEPGCFAQGPGRTSRRLAGRSLQRTHPPTFVRLHKACDDPSGCFGGYPRAVRPGVSGVRRRPPYRRGAHILPRIEREADEVASMHPVDFLLGLDMVGVAAESVPVSGFDHGPVTSPITCWAARARAISRMDCCARTGKKPLSRRLPSASRCPGVAMPRPVSESEGFTQTHVYRRSPWEHFPKDVGIVGIERAV